MPDMELNMEELAQKDGKEGRPVYIAYEGKIYDVSQSKLWKTGTHMKRHPSGKDLTTDMSAAPHGPKSSRGIHRSGLSGRRPKLRKSPFSNRCSRHSPFFAGTRTP